MHEQDTDNQRDCDEQRYHEFGGGACTGDAVFHLFRLFEKNVRTVVDFSFPVLFGVVQNDVLDALDTIEEVSVERGELLTVVHARCFEFARRNERHDDTDNDKSCERN